MEVIGLDLGGTKAAAAAFSPAGELLRREVAELAGRSGAAVAALLAELARRVLADLPDGSNPLRSIGVAVPGIYRAASGTVWAPNIPRWDDYPLVAELGTALPGARIRVDSDRACAVLGESWAGAARGSRHVVFLVVGTGIGAGILSDGRVLRGADDAAGAIGWLALRRPYLPGYRAVGCFEHHASGPGIAGRAAELVADDAGYRGPLRPPPGAPLTARDVFAAWESGDGIAERVLDDAVVCWGMAVANLVSLFNPEMVVLGGGLFGPAARFLDRIREEATRWAQPIAMGRVRLEITRLGPDAVLYGAARLALSDPSTSEA